MSFYPVSLVSATVAGGGKADLADLTSRVVAVPVSALGWPVRDGVAGDRRSALVVAPDAAIRSGDVVVFCKIVLIAPAVVRRDGRVQVKGRPCDHARLGMLEAQLEEMTGPETIEKVAAGVRLGGRIKGSCRREMSVAFAIRAVLLMTVFPEADYQQVFSLLLGDLRVLPWERARAVPSSRVLSTWREAIGPQPLRELQRLVLEAAAAEHHTMPARIEVGGGLRVGAIDGTVTKMLETKRNRAEFGTAGSAGTGFPQIRHLHVSDAFTRATLAVVTGAAGGDKAEAEQQLLDRVLAEYPHVFTGDRLWIMDRNFPGVARIKTLLGTKGHVLIRVKSDIRLPRIGDFATDGSYQAMLTGSGESVIVRVIEFHVSLAGETTPELFCLITDLLDVQEHPAHLLAAAYRWRWDGSETALREAKSTLHGAGPGTGAMLRSASADLITQEHAAWITSTELVHALTRAAAGIAAPFSKGPRTGQPVQARDLSFTAARRTAITSIATGTATATLPAPARAAAHHDGLQTIAGARVTTDRNRHRDRKIKSSQPFPHAPRDIATRVIPALIQVCGAEANPKATITDLHPATPTSSHPPNKITEYAA